MVALTLRWENFSNESEGSAYLYVLDTQWIFLIEKKKNNSTREDISSDINVNMGQPSDGAILIPNVIWGCRSSNQWSSLGDKDDEKKANIRTGGIWS